MVPSRCVPDITKTMTLKDLERAFDSVNDIMSNIDNFHLKNTFLFGKWLDYAYNVFMWKQSFAMLLLGPLKNGFELGQK